MNSLRSITTAAEETKLTTGDRVKRELSISGTDDDTLLAAKIDEATSDIAVRVAPSLKRETVTVTFWPEIDRQGRVEIIRAPSLILKAYPIASVASVTLDDVLVDAVEYRLVPENGILYRLDSSGYPSSWCFSKSAIVVCDAGYLLPGQEGRDLPFVLEAAAVELVTSYWVSRGRDPTLRSEENVGVSRFDYWVGAVGESGDLPPGVMSKLQGYLRTGLGVW